MTLGTDKASVLLSLKEGVREITETLNIFPEMCGRFIFIHFINLFLQLQSSAPRAPRPYGCHFKRLLFLLRVRCREEAERWIEEYQNVSLSEILAAPLLPVLGTFF